MKLFNIFKNKYQIENELYSSLYDDKVIVQLLNDSELENDIEFLNKCISIRMIELKHPKCENVKFVSKFVASHKDKLLNKRAYDYMFELSRKPLKNGEEYIRNIYISDIIPAGYFNKDKEGY